MTVGALSLAVLGTPAVAADGLSGPSLAGEHGCLNCHHAQAHSAPTLASLSGRVARGGDQPEALQHMLKEMRGADGIHTHQMVTDESALLILRWLAQRPR